MDYKKKMLMLNSCKYSGNFTNILLKHQNTFNWMYEVINANHSPIFVDIRFWKYHVSILCLTFHQFFYYWILQHMNLKLLFNKQDNQCQLKQLWFCYEIFHSKYNISEICLNLKCHLYIVHLYYTSDCLNLLLIICVFNDFIYI